MPRFLENSKAVVWAFSMQWKPRDREIRFSSASNAFSPPSVLPNLGGKSLDTPTTSRNEGCEEHYGALWDQIYG
ncbi:MAG: hypothetical protein SWE60_12745 [Thermodesulfobacteriota bacterium]|nr:hypothetical protein [Thermodesulfobacteriota bacterium]